MLDDKKKLNLFFICFQVSPDVVLEVAWRNKIIDHAFPYLIQYVKECTLHSKHVFFVRIIIHHFSLFIYLDTAKVDKLVAAAEPKKPKEGEDVSKPLFRFVDISL